MSRNALKTNYEMLEGTLLEDFETIGDWSVTGTGATIEAEDILVKNGSHSLKVTSVDAVSAYTTKTVSLDLSEVDRFTMWVYIEDVSKYYQSTVALMYFRTDTTNYFLCNINASQKTNLRQVVNGWNFLEFNKDDFDINNSPDWSSITELRVRALSLSGETQSLIIDDLRYGYYSKPKVVITFDDGNESDYTKAFSYMQPLGLKGMCFVPGAKVGLTNQITLAQMQEMYADGWDMGNHSYTHVDLTTLTSEEVVAELQNDIAYLESNGMPKGAKFLGVPFSAYNDSTMADYATANITAARTGMNRLQNNVVADFYQLSRKEIVATTSLATAKGYIDEVSAKSGVYLLNLHDIVDSSATATDWLTADFEALIDYIKAKQDEGILEVVTMSEWYDGLDGRRKELVTPRT